MSNVIVASMFDVLLYYIQKGALHIRVCLIQIYGKEYKFTAIIGPCTEFKGLYKNLKTN